MAVSELGYKTLVGTDRAISAINGLRDKSAYLVGHPVPAFRPLKQTQLAEARHM